MKNNAAWIVYSSKEHELGRMIVARFGEGRGIVSTTRFIFPLIRQFLKKEKLYKETIKIFPQLKKKDINEYDDYADALKLKCSLEHMIGIEVFKQYKKKKTRLMLLGGGILKIWNECKDKYLILNKAYALIYNLANTNQQIKAFENILEKQINDFDYDEILNNLNILKQKYENYEILFDTIFFNFAFFINYHKRIMSWLLDDEFVNEYVNKNHPYPSLLHPDKADDINSDDAYDINLPLNDGGGRLKMVWLYNPGAGGSFSKIVFGDCVDEEHRDCIFYDIENEYKNGERLHYKFIREKGIIVGLKVETIKLYYLFPKNVPVVINTRDPLMMFKHIINHQTWRYNSVAEYHKVLLFINNKITNDMFYQPRYDYINEFKPNVKAIKLAQSFSNLTTRINIIKDKAKSIECLNFDRLSFENAFDTIKYLADKYGFDRPKTKEMCKMRLNTSRGDTLLGIIKIIINKDLRFMICSRYSWMFSSELTPSKHHPFEEEIFDGDEKKLKEFKIFTPHHIYKKLKENKELFESAKKYANEYIEALMKHQENIRNNLVTTDEMLEYFRQNQDECKRWDKIFKEELSYIKQTHPEYIDTFKDYLEFKKIADGIKE